MFSIINLRFGACLVFVLLSCLCVAHANAQGLVGAPLDPRDPHVLQVIKFTDAGYEMLTNHVQLSTWYAALLACVLAGFRGQKVRGNQLVGEICALALVPLCVYFFGMYSLGLGSLGCHL